MRTTHPTIALLQSSSLASVVQGELERMILSGELGPGDRLTEVALATRLGVSRGPLREAFRMLEEAGLVRTEKNRGVFVRDVPIAEAIEIFDVRAALDEWIGRRLAEVIAAEALSELGALAEAIEQALAAADAPACRILELRFQERLVELVGNAKLTAIHRRLVKELSLFQRLSRVEAGPATASADEHRRLVAAIASRDPDAAGKAMLAHAMRCKSRAIPPGPRHAPAARKAAHAL